MLVMCDGINEYKWGIDKFFYYFIFCLVLTGIEGIKIDLDVSRGKIYL